MDRTIPLRTPILLRSVVNVGKDDERSPALHNTKVDKMQRILVTAIALSFSFCHAAPHEKRLSNYISSCGGAWMARDDVRTNNGKVPRRGYLTAVAEFYGGADPHTNGIPGYVYFEVHNKQTSASHTVDANNAPPIYRNFQTIIPSAGGASILIPRGAPGRSDQAPFHTMHWERKPH